MKSFISLLLTAQIVVEANALVTLNLTSTVISYLSPLIGPQFPVNEPQEDNILDTEYDFIIVGSGSAGCVIANRLSENPKWNILLLEAGTWGNVFTDIPVMAPAFQVTPYNWGYTMERQKGFCNAMEDNLCSWPRGRAVGGSTIINYVIYTRGNPLDFKRWRAQGNPGWSYEEVLPYYLKSENCNLGEQCNNPYHKTGGYLSSEYPYATKLTNIFLRAGEELGENLVDYNSADFMGFSRMQANLKHGRRHSAAAAFLDPILNRTNLRIITSARVTKILINPETKVAYGVEFYKHRVKYTVRARNEVILSAGTFHSPQLLMLSGIGPKEHLKELGIPLIQNLPVGESLYDHISFIGAMFTINETIWEPTFLLNPVESLNWLFNGKGPLSSLGGVEAIAYIKTAESREQENYPDIELLLVSIGSMQFDYGLISRRELRVRQDVYNEFIRPLENKPCYMILPMLLHPESKGHLKLRSKDPFDRPLLYGNYFSDPDNHDIKTMISSIRYIKKLSQTRAFQTVGAKLYEKPIPGCEHLVFDSDSYWECGMRSMGVTVHHQVSTCKMGPASDSESVVDSRLRVYGIKNLRVADTSVIPVTLSAHTSAPGMMIGEKASDIIKEDWNILR